MLGPILLLLALLLLPLHTHPPSFISNFNSSACVPSSFDLPVLSYTQFPLQTFMHNKLQILQNFSLKRYEFIDSDFTITQISQADQLLLRNHQTPVQIFDQFRIFIQNYQVLTEREFQLTMVNPTNSIIFCVKQIFIDIPNVKRIQHKKLPFCINQKTKYPFNFKIYLQDVKQRLVKFGVFFVIDMMDRYTEKFIEQRIWGKEIVVKVLPNWLKHVGAINVNSNSKGGLPYQTVELKNPSTETMVVDVFSTTNFIGLADQELHENKLMKIQLKKKASVLVYVQKKAGELFIHNVNNLTLQNIKIPIIIKKEFYIEPINIGIFPSKRVSLETYVCVTNTLSQPVTLTKIELSSRAKTIQILPLTSSDIIIPAQTTLHPIAKIKIYPGTGDDQLIKSSLKISYTSNSLQKSLKDEEIAETSFTYYEILNALTNMEKRFFYLYEGYSKTKKRFQDTLFQIKNSLNIPIRLSNVVVDQHKFKITWISDKKEYIYPNRPYVLFKLQYIGEQSLSSPSSSQLMLLQFNNNMMIPIQLVLYDKKLQCRYSNSSNKCSNYQRLDLGNFRSTVNNTREFRIVNTNPSQLKVYIKPVKINNNTRITVLGPFPSDENYSRPLNASQTVISTLKHRMSLVIKFQIKCNEAGYYSEIVNVVTQEENFNIEFIYRLSEGALSLHPNPLIVINQYLEKNIVVYMVSTFLEQYQLLSVETNISSLKIRQIKSEEIIKPNQAKQINIQYTPTLIQTISFQNILSLIQKSNSGQNTIGYIKIKTNQDLERTIHTVVTNAIIPLLPQRNIGLINVIQKSINNKLILKVANFYNLTIKVKVALIEPEFVKHPTESKYVMKRYKQKSSFYLCLSEFAKSKLKLTPSIIRSLLHLDSTPSEVFIEALEDGRVFMQWHHKEEFKTYQSLEKQIGKKILSSIYSGSRNCFKGESTLYFKQLFNSEQFIKVLELADSNTFFEFVEREYDNFMNPSLVLQFDPFYKKLNITSSRCFFKFCNYVPIEYPKQMYFLEPNQIVNISLNIRESIQYLRPIAFTVISSIGRTQYDIIEFKSMKMAMRLQTVKDHNRISQVSSMINNTNQNYLPILLTPSDYKSGHIKGERSYTFRNIGDIDINITSILFEDTYEPQVFEGFEIVNPSGFVISKGSTESIDVKFKMTHVPTKPVSIYLYSPTNYYFKLKLIVLANGLNKSLSEPAPLYFILIALSTIYLGLVLKIVLKEKEEGPLKYASNVKKTVSSVVKKPLKKLNFTYVNQLKQKLAPPPDPSEIQSVRSESIIKNIEQVISRQSIESRESQSFKQQIISIEDNRSEIASNSNEVVVSEKQDDEPYYPIKKKSLDSEEESLGSGSSLSDQIFAEIDNFNKNYNNFKHQNSNSDKNQSQSGDSIKFYNAFLSGGPLLFKPRNSGEQFFDEDIGQIDQPQK